MVNNKAEYEIKAGKIPIIKRSLLALVAVTLIVSIVNLAALFTVSVSVGMRISSADRLYTCGQIDMSCSEYSESASEELKEFDADAVLVLGALVWGDRPSYVLEDRIITGSNLYLGGYAEKILMSGDNEREDYNELDPMINYASDKMGVPRDAILCDRLGLNTYASVRRAIDECGLKRVIIVSQEFHLPRALYIAKSLGLEAVGVSADLRSYSSASKSAVREYAARTKDFLKVGIEN